MQVAEEKACMIWYPNIDKAIKFKHKWGNVAIPIVTISLIFIVLPNNGAEYYVAAYRALWSNEVTLQTNGVKLLSNLESCEASSIIDYCCQCCHFCENGKLGVDYNILGCPGICKVVGLYSAAWLPAFIMLQLVLGAEMERLTFLLPITQHIPAYFLSS